MTEAAVLEGPTGQDGASRRTVVVALGANVLVAATKTLAGVLTGSASMAAEAAHSWADTGNGVFLLIAQHRSRREPDARHPSGFGREAYVWSLLAALGLFAAGATVSFLHGLDELRSSTPAEHFPLAYVVLGVAFLLEGGSFLQSVRQGREGAQHADRDLLEHILATSDPTLRAVFAEDAAALVGIALAAVGVALHQLTGSAVPDAIGSLLIGVLLAVVSVTLIDRNRRFLVGEAVDPRIRAAALKELTASAEVRSVTFLHLEYSGPQQVSLLARVDLTGDAPESRVAERIARLEAEVASRPGISNVVLALAHPGDAALVP